MAGDQRLGFIGLGNIGGAVSANLVADGHHVTGFDIDRSRLQRLLESGGHEASSPADVASVSDLTFLSLPTPAIMEAVSHEWLEGAAGSGKVLVDLTTNAPSTVRKVGEELSAADVYLVEAPLTGGAIGARNRALLFIVGGDARVVEKVTPLLETIGRGTVYMGGLGCGNVGKLINSLMAFATQFVALEGLALAARNDIDLRSLVEMVRISGGASSYFDRRVEEIAERGRPADFALELAAKDAGLMLEVGREGAVPLPVASAIHQMLVFAKAQGFGGHDISDMVEVMERAAGLTLNLRPADPS
jgi:3-hydroxyisobutyrate dehydrogenase-like beta-hydroxyacid dehydrogenase